MADKFDKKELLNWIETQPELKFIRDKASRTFVSYDTSEKDINKRITVIGDMNLDIKKGLLQKLWELVWVPGRQLRGTSYSDENLDKRLSATSALMSFSTIWDMVCTFPVLFYVMKGLAIFTVPAATAASLLILAMSNAAGKFAMDRNKGNKALATFLLFIFFQPGSLELVNLGLIVNDQIFQLGLKTKDLRLSPLTVTLINGNLNLSILRALFFRAELGGSSLILDTKLLNLRRKRGLQLVTFTGQGMIPTQNFSKAILKLLDLLDGLGLGLLVILSLQRKTRLCFFQLIYNKDNVYDDDKNNPTHKENCNKLFHLSILFSKPSKHGKRMIRNNSRTLLSNAKRMLQKWMNEEKENPNNNNNQNVRISIPLFNTLYNAVQKCLELQILYDFIKKKNWHAADEYCSHTMTNNNNNNNEEEQQLSPSPSSTNHLITILNMVKKEYSYLQMQNKHHVYKNKSNITTISVSSTATTTSSMQHERLQPELINILKDVTIEEKKMKSKSIDYLHTHTHTRSFMMKNCIF